MISLSLNAGRSWFPKILIVQSSGNWRVSSSSEDQTFFFIPTFFIIIYFFPNAGSTYKDNGAPRKSHYLIRIQFPEK
jgi:hypothetical protein